MRKKGFTLIELLAVIVILGTIALISIPIILNIIEDSKKEAFKTSVQSVFTAFETYELQNGFSIDEKVNILDLPLTRKENFTSGKVYKEGNTVKVENVSNGSYCVSGTVENLQLIEGNSDVLDNTPPVINNVKNETKTNAIKIYTTYKEEESFISKHEYRIALETENIEEKEWTNGDILTGNLSVKSFTGLIVNTTYKIQVRLTNTSLENNVSEVYELEVTTLHLEKPVITLLTDKEYAISKEIKLVYPEGTGLTYEYSLDGNTWDSISEKEKILTIEENKTIRARVYDGTNYVYADSLTISGIDKTKPIVTITKNMVENKNVLTTVVEPTNTPSGYTYTWYKNGGILSEQNSSTLTTITAGVYQLKVTTKADVESVSNEIEIKSYTITYNVNGGTGNIASQTKIEDIPLTLTSTVPTKEGYQFQGWGVTNSDKVATYTSGNTYTKNESITLYAIWKSKITVESLVQNNPYSYYLYFKFKDNEEHLYLSNTKMGIMEHYSDDSSKRIISIPSYYRPSSTYTLGDHYKVVNGEWIKITSNSNLNAYFTNVKGDNAKLENINNWFDKFCYNYQITLYKNNTAGTISTYKTLNNSNCLN